MIALQLGNVPKYTVIFFLLHIYDKVGQKKREKTIYFPHQSLKKLNFCVKLRDSIFFLLGFLLSSNYFDLKRKSLQKFYVENIFNSLRNCKETQKIKL